MVEVREGAWLTVVDTVVGGSIEHQLQGPEPVHHLRVDPELVEQVELLVDQVGRRRHHQCQRQVEELEGGEERGGRGEKGRGGQGRTGEVSGSGGGVGGSGERGEGERGEGERGEGERRAGEGRGGQGR